MDNFNDYLVFADEAGDHLLKPHFPEFPLFVLAFCVINRKHYASYVVPELLRIKLKYFQDPYVIFHERDIRKAIGDFEFLVKKEIRENFLDDLNQFFEKAQFTVIASVIRKDILGNIYSEPDNPYDIGTKFCMERLLYFLNRHDQKLPSTIIFEARGKKEDKDLELTFLRLMQKRDFQGRFNMRILPKIADCTGLQIADLVARPIGRYVLNPNQPNRAFDIIKHKIDSPNGKMDGYGLKIFPK